MILSNEYNLPHNLIFIVYVHAFNSIHGANNLIKKEFFIIVLIKKNSINCIEHVALRFFHSTQTRRKLLQTRLRLGLVHHHTLYKHVPTPLLLSNSHTFSPIFIEIPKFHFSFLISSRIATMANFSGLPIIPYKLVALFQLATGLGGAPSNDGESLHVRVNAGTAIDQVIAYGLLIAALVITYSIHWVDDLFFFFLHRYDIFFFENCST